MQSRIGGLGFAPWWEQAIVFAAIGGGTSYYVATNHDHWYSWLLPAAAWLGFAWAVLTRTPQ